MTIKKIIIIIIIINRFKYYFGSQPLAFVLN